MKLRTVAMAVIKISVCLYISRIAQASGRLAVGGMCMPCALLFPATSFTMRLTSGELAHHSGIKVKVA